MLGLRPVEVDHPARHVADGDQAHQPAVGDDREVPAAPFGEERHRLARRSSRGHGDAFGRHDVGDPGGWGSSPAPTTRRRMSRSVKMPASQAPSQDDDTADADDGSFQRRPRAMVAVGETACTARALALQQDGDRSIHGVTFGVRGTIPRRSGVATGISGVSALRGIAAGV